MNNILSFGDDNMNKLEIDNLGEIIKLKYPNILLNYFDLEHLVNIPKYKREFYRMNRYFNRSYKLGYFNNGATTIWMDSTFFSSHPSGYLKISFNKNIQDGNDPNATKGWSDLLSFKEEGSPMKIYKIVKMRMFW